MMKIVAIFAVLASLLPPGSGESPPRPSRCPEACPLLHSPVCATLTTTFSNPCVMTAAQCTLDKESLSRTDATNGSCGSSPPPVVNAGRRSASTKRDADCPLVACTRQYQPVCASYSGNFGNECAMNAAICRLERELHVSFDATPEECPMPVS